jgi:hypothetical protein
VAAAAAKKDHNDHHEPKPEAEPQSQATPDSSEVVK